MVNIIVGTKYQQTSIEAVTFKIYVFKFYFIVCSITQGSLQNSPLVTLRRHLYLPWVPQSATRPLGQRLTSGVSLLTLLLFQLISDDDFTYFSSFSLDRPIRADSRLAALLLLPRRRSSSSFILSAFYLYFGVLTRVFFFTFLILFHISWIPLRHTKSTNLHTKMF